MSYQEDRFTEIADAIREKDGSEDPIVANDFAARILSIPVGGSGVPGDDSSVDLRIGDIPWGDKTSTNPIQVGDTLDGLYFNTSVTPDFSSIGEAQTILEYSLDDNGWNTWDTSAGYFPLDDDSGLYGIIITSGSFIYAYSPTLDPSDPSIEDLNFKHWGWDPEDLYPDGYRQFDLQDRPSIIIEVNEDLRSWWSELLAKTSDGFLVDRFVTVKEYIDDRINEIHAEIGDIDAMLDYINGEVI